MQKKEYSKARKYESPKAEIICFDSEDIVIATTGGGGQSGHSTLMPAIY